MLLHFLINKLCCECFQFQTKKHEDTQTEPCAVVTLTQYEKFCKFKNSQKVVESSTQTKKNQKVVSTQTKKPQKVVESSTQTITEPLLKTKSEQPTAPKAVHVSTNLLPVHIETRKENETVPKFLHRMKGKHGVHIKKAKKIIDGHGHMFYCFSCPQPHKNHKSFDSKEDLQTHCEAKHNLKITI